MVIGRTWSIVVCLSLQVSFDVCLVPRRCGRRATIGLLARVPRGRRRTTWRRSITTASALGPTRGTARRRGVLLLLLAVLALRRTTVATLLTVLLLRGLAILLLRRRNLGAALLVLSVIGRVNRAQDELENPEIGSEIDWRVGAGHLGGLVLVVGRAVYHTSNGRVIVKLAEEFGGYLVIRFCLSMRSLKIRNNAKSTYLSDRFQPVRTGRRWRQGQGSRSIGRRNGWCLREYRHSRLRADRR